MPQSDIPAEAGSIELQIIDGVEAYVITGRDFILIACYPDLPNSISPYEKDGKIGLLINGNFENGGLVIQGKSVVLHAPVIHVIGKICTSEPLLTEAQDIAGAINELAKILKGR